MSYYIQIAFYKKVELLSHCYT